MRIATYTSIVLVLCALALPAFAKSIPDDQLDRSKIYYGSPENFEKPAEVDIEKAIQATPEWKEITRKKIDSGTARYWILITDATDRVYKAISEVGDDSGYDLIAEKGYLGKLEPAVSSKDVTKDIIEKVSA